MDSSSGATSEMAPLDQIRRAEAEVVRRVAAAQAVASAALAKAASQTEELNRQAREMGQCEGRERFQQTVSQTEDEAQALIMSARCQAERLRQQGEARMDVATKRAVEVVLGYDTETAGA